MLPLAVCSTCSGMHKLWRSYIKVVSRKYLNSHYSLSISTEPPYVRWNHLAVRTVRGIWALICQAVFVAGFFTGACFKFQVFACGIRQCTYNKSTHAYTLTFIWHAGVQLLVHRILSVLLQFILGWPIMWCICTTMEEKFNQVRC